MHTDLPAQSRAAIATVVAALIAGAISFVNLTLNKEQKTSEFRQAWIDGLRQDLATFFAAARAFARAAQEKQAGQKVDDPFAMTAEKISDIRYQVAETHYRIRLRLNLKESEHKELLRLMRMATDEQSNWLQGNGDVSRTLKAIETAAEYAPQILKSEWERVKKGELAFRLARNWIAPLIVSISLAFVILVWTGKMKI
jgi:hypothetical protein